MRSPVAIPWLLEDVAVQVVRSVQALPKYRPMRLGILLVAIREVSIKESVVLQVMCESRTQTAESRLTRFIMAWLTFLSLL